ncbi:uncharacterized protein LOC105771861 [Gossypium raimondii]|uniref:uncharacterized protein LOC105771861 n=1 Tax=Gossypium raimondii TaxID=29730 RepID=UPI00063AA874|nr:uncharacterized protein LOC105771861 [Gossypium raimondii]
MSTCGTRGRGIRGYGRGHRRAQAEFSSLGSMPNLDMSETLVSLATKAGSQSRSTGDDALSQAMLRMFERVAGPHSGSRGFSLLHDESYKWWLSIKEGTQPDRLNWGFFKTASQGKHVRASYVDARRREFMNLTQGDRSMVQYEAEFLRLSHYARGMVAYEYEKCVRFEDGLRDILRALISPQREREFSILVDKAKITEEFKLVKRQN